MYLVANTSKKTICISDLNVEIPPNQCRDLHNMDLPIKPEDSKHLSIAKSRGFLRVLKHDIPEEKKKIVEKKTVIKKKEVLSDKMLQVIREEIQNYLSSNSNNMQQVSQKETQKMILKMMKKMDTIIPSSNKSTDEESINDQIDESVLREIHARAVNRIVENADGSINYKQEDKIDDSIDEKASELEDLI